MSYLDFVFRLIPFDAAVDDCLCNSDCPSLIHVPYYLVPVWVSLSSIGSKYAFEAR